MSLPSAAPPPGAQEFPAYRLREFLPSFLAGWVLGALFTVLVRALGQLLLRTPCEGHTALALAVPLLLGPGGLAFTALSWRRPARAALGLGLMVASFLPGLFVGARDIGALRTQGCAGGYVVLATPGTKSVSSLTIPAGQTRELTGRIGGFTPQTHPEPFDLKSESSTPNIVVELPKTRVGVGERFSVRVTVKKGTPINTFQTGVEASQTVDGKTYVADGLLEISVRP